ncbi:hypothetical protein DH09_17660 [Bacillaceae bacterium JMAK1]|nr:hypothetical protein DH09_17660 [Bacillaceae bacterium JMAK1]
MNHKEQTVVQSIGEWYESMIQGRELREVHQMKLDVERRLPHEMQSTIKMYYELVLFYYNITYHHVLDQTATNAKQELNPMIDETKRAVSFLHHSLMGELNHEQGNYNSAIDSYHRAEEYMHGIGEEKKVLFYDNLGQSYLKLNNSYQAEVYFRRAMSFSSKDSILREDIGFYSERKTTTFSQGRHQQRAIRSKSKKLTSFKKAQ